MQNLVSSKKKKKRTLALQAAAQFSFCSARRLNTEIRDVIAGWMVGGRSSPRQL